MSKFLKGWLWWRCNLLRSFSTSNSSDLRVIKWWRTLENAWFALPPFPIMEWWSCFGDFLISIRASCNFSSRDLRASMLSSHSSTLCMALSFASTSCFNSEASRRFSCWLSKRSSLNCSSCINGQQKQDRIEKERENSLKMRHTNREKNTPHRSISLVNDRLKTRLLFQMLHYIQLLFKLGYKLKRRFGLVVDRRLNLGQKEKTKSTANRLILLNYDIYGILAFVITSFWWKFFGNR